jgi:hypothetical protein
MGEKRSKSKPPKPTGRGAAPPEVTKDKAPRIPPQEEAWKPSTLGDVDLDLLVAEEMLQDKERIQWKSCYGEKFPTEGKEELVVFRSFVERGFAEPPSEFFQDLMGLYGLELHHLNPNGISYIATFAHFFETFLGIPPSLEFFQYLFHVKPQPSKPNIKVVGGAGIQLRQGSRDHWFPMPLKNKQEKWDSEWFVIGKLYL